MVYRIFVEKKPGLDNEARAIKNDITALLQLPLLEMKKRNKTLTTKEMKNIIIS